jgi:hypothetical protein
MTNVSQNPKVSALCVSHASRFGLLQRAMVSFAKQTYENAELLVLIGQPGYLDMVLSFMSDPRTDEILGKAKERIKILHTPFNNSMQGAQLAALRAEGNVLVCWDDDDLRHPECLAHQVSRFNGIPILYSESLYYFYDSEELFVTNYAQPTGQASERCASGSLMLERNDWPLEVAQGERRPWSTVLLSLLSQRHHYQFISGYPQYFMAGSNGNNWRPASLHRQMGSNLPLTWNRAKLLDNKDTVAEWVQAYSLPQAEIDVCGKDAQAFKVEDVPTSPDWFATTAPPDDWHFRVPNQEHANLVNQERQQQRQAQQRNRQQPQGNAPQS